MHLNFCTLFNWAYLSRGLTMYHSLIKNCPDFHLYIFAFDEETLHFFRQQHYPNLTVISLHDFEDDELLSVKPSRSAGEYCWTCTPSTIRYCIQKFNLDHCTYIDADLLFYADPSVLIDEMKTNSVLITEHRYTAAYNQSLTSGIYCVQFVMFKNDENGMIALNWWRKACLDWCFARVEDGKFGDQKYLDDWTSRFKGVHVLQNLGGGLAPWNVQQYKFYSANDTAKISALDKTTQKKFAAVFFHFHGLKFHPSGLAELTGSGYKLDKVVVKLFYRKYMKELIESAAEIKMTTDFSDPHGTSKTKLSPLFLLSIQNMLYNLKLLVKSLVNNKSYRRQYNHFYNIKELTK